MTTARRRTIVMDWWHDGHPIVPIRLTHTADMDLTWIGRACNEYHLATRWLRPSWWASR